MIQLQAPMIILMALLIQIAGANEPPAWVRPARQLIGENQGTREQSVAELKKVFAEIEDLLPELDGPYRGYALDVAVALKLPGSVEKMLPMVEEDKDGALTLAVNALMDDRTFRTIAEHYIRFMEREALPSVSVPVLMAMTDYLTHLRVGLSTDLFAALLGHPRLEIQQVAALHFAVANKKNLVKIMRKHFPQLHPQVRAQMILTYYDRRDFKEVKKICSKDADPIVATACQGLDLKEKRGKPERKKKRK